MVTQQTSTESAQSQAPFTTTLIQYSTVTQEQTTTQAAKSQVSHTTTVVQYSTVIQQETTTETQTRTEVSQVSRDYTETAANQDTQTTTVPSITTITTVVQVEATKLLNLTVSAVSTTTSKPLVNLFAPFCKSGFLSNPLALCPRSSLRARWSHGIARLVHLRCSSFSLLDTVHRGPYLSILEPAADVFKQR